MDAQGYRNYLGVIADCVIWLQSRRYAVRLIIGDAQYETQIREDLISLVEARGATAEPPPRLADPVQTVEEPVRQLGEADAVASLGFHKLVRALTLNKPLIVLSDLAVSSALGP